MATKMKQFNEWWLMEAQNVVGVGRAQEKDVAQEAWKAALEWALNHKKPIKYKDYKFDYIKTDVIKEELNGNK